MAGANDTFVGDFRYDSQGRKLWRAVAEDAPLGLGVRAGMAVRASDGVEEVVVENIVTSAVTDALTAALAVEVAARAAANTAQDVVTAALDVRVTRLIGTMIWLDDFLPVGWVTDVTDVTTQVQAAVTAASGNQLVCSNGIYIISAEITIPSNTTLWGMGEGTIFKRLGNGAAGGLKIFTNSNKAAFGNNSGIAIRNLTVDFSSCTSNDPYNNPIHMRYVDGVVVEGCRIRGGGSGCHIEACDNARVHNCRVDSFTDKGISVSFATGFGGVNLTDPKVIISNNTIHQTAATAHAAGSSLTLATQDNTVFLNNSLSNTDTTLGGHGLELGDASGSKVIGNTYSGCSILIGSGQHMLIADNMIMDGSVPGAAMIQVALTGVTQNPTRHTIINNHIHCVATAAVDSAISVGSTASFIRLEGNVLTGGGYFDCRGHDCEIRDNTVEAAFRHGIIVASCNRPRIFGNTARDCGVDAAGGATTKVGFMFDTLVDPQITNNLAVSQNVATADMRHGYYINACTNIRWRDNDSRGHTTAAVTTTGTPTYDNAKEIITVASAAALTLPGRSNVFLISGNTSVTSIVATGWAGHTVTLNFSGTNATGVVDGSNLKLTANFPFTPDDTMTLYCDGTNWYEQARATN